MPTAPRFHRATIKLANPHTGDLLTVSGVLPGAITTARLRSWDRRAHAHRCGHAGEYETALQQILYSSTSDNPGTEDRLIEVVVNDGANNSNVAAALISVIATNDAPVITVDPSTAYVENAAPVLLSLSASLTDVDNTEFGSRPCRSPPDRFPATATP